MDFNSALSGLQAASSDLSVISNNIANSATNGFKSSRVQFADVYANSAFGVASNAIGSGVTIASVTQQFSQGQIQFTNNNLDLAINGQGFFILSDNGTLSFTRAGAFGVDSSGFVIDSLNNVLQGYLADKSGNITGAQGNMQLSSANLPPLASQNVAIDMNLDATILPPVLPFVPGFTSTFPPDPSTFNTSTSTTIYDSLGNNHIMTSYFIKAHEPNTWRIFIGIDGTDVTPPAAPIPGGPIPAVYPPNALANPYTVVFDTSGNYVPSATSIHPAYYGPGPVVSTALGLVNTGTQQTLNLNDLTINGVPITNSVASTDIFSTTGNAASSISVAAAINQSLQSTGVTASVNPTVADLGIPAFGNLTAGEFGINGVPIIGVNGTIVQLLGLINAQTAVTGVVGSQPGGAGTAVLLTAADGRNIEVTTNGASAGANFSLFALNGGVALDKAQSGTINLATTNNQGIIIGGNNPGHVGLITGPQAGIIQTASDNIVIPGWTPSGGAAGPQIVNVNFSASTQYGAPFSVLALSQDGYTTGRLTGVDVNNTGVFLAKYTNGQSLALGQIALANFGDVQGLSPIGNTNWIDTFTSGQALIGAPGTADLGVVQSGALEESNVELTNELVNLIVAQSNFQANAQSIRAADAVTQTIINIR